MAEFQLTPYEELWVENPNDKARIHSFIVKPPDFQSGKKYPLLLLIHGGPQGAWGSPGVIAGTPRCSRAAGYVVVMPNPRGSTGYGQKFTDDINQDWGGKPYEDIMAVVDHMAGRSYVDSDRLAAAGGSYGGYMVNWLLGHTSRFKAFVSHAGCVSICEAWRVKPKNSGSRSGNFTGCRGRTPRLYAKFSPSYYVQDFKTPTLVMHGELDYRVPVGQGMQLFTALQLQKVPSKIVVFPDEGHWVLKPQNSVFWYRNFLDWIGEWTAEEISPRYF